MKVEFSAYGILPVRKSITNSFDHCCAGQIGNDGIYYCIHTDHLTHEMYAVDIPTEQAFTALGRPLGLNEPEQMVAGNLVRPMTAREEQLWNEDRLLANVDCWGNIEVNDTFDHEWYMEHCI